MGDFKLLIFDLDETLYARGSGVMAEIGRRIQRWLVEQFDLAWDEAVRLRRQYYQRYGTTLGGLVAEHEVDVDHYLVYVHDISLERYLQPNLALAAMLERLPMRKSIYTNASAAHARRVLRALDVAEHFERVVGIEEVGLLNKPEPRAYDRALDLLGAEGSTAVMVEDSARNLRPAKALGMTTILVDGPSAPWVDYVVDDVLDVGDVIDRHCG